ncbi:hypothetical protein [Chitinophaga sp. CF418]|uniref:hypothetical protein n=1 Tax=Chitinophaga sp. CF418 TaxID=1855287 RepID=UPI0009241710|nr:hypothetical protein [Chitinophaga sp. CF418]SHM12762.1 hypothetical protein SAMN05216311_101660 [Chitinophaga sp. CF418]
MKRYAGFTVVIIFLIIFLVLSYSRQQSRVKQVLSENERLINENRDLRHSLDVNSQTARQIADRSEIRVRSEGQFVERRTYYRRNWKQFIAVTTSDYRTGFLGGIKDLQIIVRNQSEYPLDNVVVSVEYMRGNGDVFKTEEYTINDVPAKGTKSVQASSSRKGQKVELRLLSITSQPMNFCWSANKPAPPGNPDPYLCTPQQ